MLYKIYSALKDCGFTANGRTKDEKRLRIKRTFDNGKYHTVVHEKSNNFVGWEVEVFGGSFSKSVGCPSEMFWISSLDDIKQMQVSIWNELGVAETVLPKGTLNCPKCKEKLEFELIGGMRVHTNNLFSARCKTEDSYFKVLV